MVGMRKGKYRKIKVKKKKKSKKPQKVGVEDVILAIFNIALLFPVIYILSNVIADIIRFLLKIISEVT